MGEEQGEGERGVEEQEEEPSEVVSAAEEEDEADEGSGPAGAGGKAFQSTNIEQGGQARELILTALLESQGMGSMMACALTHH